MTPAEYWNMLELEIEKFDKKNMAPSNDQDKEEYTKQKNTLLKVAKIGLEATQYWDPSKIKNCVERAEALILNKDTFGEEGMPAIVGEKTRDFIKSVYIPHLQARKEVNFGFQASIFNMALRLMGSDETLEKRIQKAQLKALVLAERIESYDALEKGLQQHGLFASSKNDNSQEAKKEELKSLSPL